MECVRNYCHNTLLNTSKFNILQINILSITGTVITSLWVYGPMLVKYSLLVDESIKHTSKRTIRHDKKRQNKNSVAHEEEEQSSLFAVTPSGHIILQGSLDHEKQTVHLITVLNQTLHNPALVDYMTISVVVSLKTQYVLDFVLLFV